MENNLNGGASATKNEDEVPADLVTIKQAAELEGKKVGSINQRIQRGRLNRHLIDGRRMVSRADLKIPEEAEDTKETADSLPLTNESGEAHCDSQVLGSTPTPPSEDAAPAYCDPPPLESNNGAQSIAPPLRPAVAAAEPLTPKRVNLKAIVFDEDTQIRYRLDSGKIDEYEDKMRRGETFPEVMLFSESDDRLYIGDGWHRLLAARKAGFQTLPAFIQPGGKEAAIIYALQANETHGVPRTNRDKQRAVAIACAKWPGESNREIARRCAVSDGAVRNFLKNSAMTSPLIRKATEAQPGSVAKRKIKSPSKKRRDTFRRACKLALELPDEDLRKLMKKAGTKLNGAKAA